MLEPNKLHVYRKTFYHCFENSPFYVKSLMLMKIQTQT